MRTSLPQFILGYHGCDKSLVQKLLSGEEPNLKPSQNSYDWLGNGIYFWESAPIRALEWAEECLNNPHYTKGNIKEPAVIGAIIDLGNCLNLIDRSHQKVIREAFGGITKQCSDNGIKLPSNTEKLRTLDCAVINAAVQLNMEYHHPAFDTIRSPYFEGNPIYPGSYFLDKSHIQICVLNTDCIKGYFLPSKDNLE